MRTWTIEGADKNTGADRVITIEALTEEEAAKEAGNSGLLVSAVHELPPAIAPRPITSATPRYEDISKGSRTLDAIATIVFAIGILFIVVAIIGVFVMAAAIYTRAPEAIVTVPIIFSSLMTGVSLLIIAAIIRMFAALAVAIRDIAINSFK
jgi:hypothetical protein